MAAGHGDHRAGRIDARPGQQAAVGRLFQAEHVAAHVAHGSEAAHQGAPRFHAGKHAEVALVGRHQLRDGGTHQHAVPVRVDQARHQHAAAAVDHLGAGFHGQVRRCLLYT